MVIKRLVAIEGVLRKHTAARKPMARWIELVRVAEWDNINDARCTWQTADAIKGTNLTCFNLGGNNYRLITIVGYERRIVAVVELLTHAEYTRKYVR